MKTFEAHCSFSRFATITTSNWSKWSITILTEPLKNILHSLKNLDDDAEKYKIMFRLILSGCSVEMRCAEAGLSKRKKSKWPENYEIFFRKPVEAATRGGFYEYSSFLCLLVTALSFTTTAGSDKLKEFAL